MPLNVDVEEITNKMNAQSSEVDSVFRTSICHSFSVYSKVSKHSTRLVITRWGSRFNIWGSNNKVYKRSYIIIIIIRENFKLHLFEEETLVTPVSNTGSGPF